MFTYQVSTRCVCFLVSLFFFCGTPLFAVEQISSPEKERELIEVLKTKPSAEKAIACKQLAIYGSKEAVPELAKLLSDEQLSSWARIALEAIPDPAAGAALLKATDSLNGLLLVGTINSIGVRKDAGAVQPLANHLKNKDAQVAAAAAVALGQVGNSAATKALRGSLTTTAGPVRSAVAEGCILCAERLAKEGKSKEAAEIYDEVRKADVPKPRVLEATLGAILARNTDGIPLLKEQLKSSDKQLFRVGLSAARQLPGKEVTNVLAEELARTEADRAALLLVALADRNEEVLPQAVLNAAKSGDKQVRVAAIGVIGRLGNSSSVPTLLSIAADSDPELAQATAEALANLPGEKTNAELAAQLSKVDGNALAVLIGVVGSRRIDATDSLIKAAAHTNPAIRHAALKALGATVSPKEVSVLIGPSVSTAHPEDAKVAIKALREACVRMPDREACAAELAAAMRGATAPTQASLLEILGAMGGAKALETIDAAAKGDDATLQDTATRLLGEWMTADAAPVLLGLAKNPASKYQGRALRGYIRIARQFDMPNSQRVEMCQKALEAADRSEDKKLVLLVLERYPSPEMLKMAVKAAEDPALQEEANRAALVSIRKLGDQGSNVRELMSEAGLSPVKVEIVKAEYGAGTMQKDVTQALQKQVCELPLITLPAKSYNKSFGGDPAPGSTKKLVVEYRIDGKVSNASFQEDATIMLPMPK